MKQLLFLLLILYSFCSFAENNPLMQQQFWIKATPTDVISAIQKGANPKEVDSYQATPLHFACLFSDNVNVIQVLLNNGADVNKKDSAGLSPLSLTKNIDVFKTLIKNGANINDVDNDGNSILIQILLDEKWEAAEVLVDNSVNLNVTDRHGNSPYKLAKLLGAPQSLLTKLNK